MAWIIDHFIILLYKIIFEKDPHFMSSEEMDVIVDIPDWYASLAGTFIRVFGGENPLHVLPRYGTIKLIMQEVSYHLSTRF